MTWALLDADAIREGLNPRRVGRRIVVLGETTSTNDVALNASAGPQAEVDGLAVFAEYQSGGRGRQGRSWLSPRGASILCSVLIFGPDDVRLAGPLTLAAGIAACDAVRATTTAWPVLRWPNDLVVGGRKLAGVLVESRPVGTGRRGWVVGVGINCHQHAEHFPPDIRDRATSLEMLTAHPLDRTAMARELLRQLDAWLVAEPPEAERVRREWLDRAEPVGRRVRLLSDGVPFEGLMLDVDPDAGMLVQLDDGGRRWFDATRTQLL